MARRQAANGAQKKRRGRPYRVTVNVAAGTVVIAGVAVPAEDVIAALRAARLL